MKQLTKLQNDIYNFIVESEDGVGPDEIADFIYDQKSRKRPKYARESIIAAVHEIQIKSIVLKDVDKVVRITNLGRGNKAVYRIRKKSRNRSIKQ